MRVSVRINLPGVITDIRLTPTNVHDLLAAEDIFKRGNGWVQLLEPEVERARTALRSDLVDVLRSGETGEETSVKMVES